MANEHLTIEELSALSEGNENEAETGFAAAHLALCSECRSLLRSLPEVIRASVSRKLATPLPHLRYSKLAYRVAIERVLQRSREEIRERERDCSAARELFEELESYPVSRRRMLVANLGRFRSWALAELLLEESRVVWTGDPARAEVRSVLACDIAESLDGEGYQLLLLNDLRAQAWSYVGNSCRIRGLLTEAQRAFERAEDFLAAGSGDCEEAASLWDLKSSYLREAGEFDAALRAVDAVITCRRGQGDRHLEGRALVSKAKLLRDAGQLEAGIALLEQAEGLISPAREPRLEMVLKANKLAYLVDAGRLFEARALAAAVRKLQRLHGGRLDRLRGLWIEGRYLCAIGQVELGEQLLLQAQGGFTAERMLHDAAQIALDRAEICLDGGRLASMRTLALEASALVALARGPAGSECQEVGSPVLEAESGEAARFFFDSIAKRVRTQLRLSDSD